MWGQWTCEKLKSSRTAIQCQLSSDCQFSILKVLRLITQPKTGNETAMNGFMNMKTKRIMALKSTRTRGRFWADVKTASLPPSSKRQSRQVFWRKSCSTLQHLDNLWQGEVKLPLHCWFSFYFVTNLYTKMADPLKAVVDSPVVCIKMLVFYCIKW